MAIGYKSSVVHDFTRKLLIGMGLGALSDGVIEFLKVPILNDSGTFGDSALSNYTLAVYALSLAGTTAGIADIAVSKGVLTFTHEAFPIFLGFGLGTYFYEKTIRGLIGIQKINPYSYIGGIIPPVLPAGTRLPFISSGGSTPVAAPSVPVVVPSTPAISSQPGNAIGAQVSGFVG